MEDAVQHVNQLRDCTRSLINAIDARVITDVTRDYVDDALGLNYARLNSNKLRKALRVRTVPAAAHKYVREIYADIERFVNACNLTLKEFDFVSLNDLLDHRRGMGGMDSATNRHTNSARSANRR